MGMLGVFIGMRVRLAKKLLPPGLAQEATGEVVGIAFHPQESLAAVTAPATSGQQTNILAGRSVT